MLDLSTLDHYRPWCRHCGTTDGPCLIADDDMEWVLDEDDLGYPYCLTCVETCAKMLGLSTRPTLTLVT